MYAVCMTFKKEKDGMQNGILPQAQEIPAVKPELRNNEKEAYTLGGGARTS